MMQVCKSNNPQHPETVLVGITSKPDYEICDFCGKEVKYLKLNLLGQEKTIRGTCSCVSEKRKQEAMLKEKEKQIERVNKFFGFEKLGKRFSESTFDNWLSREGAEDVLKRCLDFTHNFDKYNEDGMGLALVGEPGNGKSHLVAAIAHEMVKQNRTCVFANVSRLLNRIQATFYPNSSESMNDILRILSTVDLLILDDIGAHKWTEKREEMLYMIVDDRYMNKKPIIITSNCAPDATIGILGNRVFDRINQMCIFERNNSTSYRYDKKITLIESGKYDL